MTGMTYEKYLHLKQLLSLQNPLTPPDQPDVHDSERLFIVVHQASEILLGQVLVDLRHLDASSRGEPCSAGCDEWCSVHRTERVIRLIATLEGNLTLLRHTLPWDDFQEFRSRFGSASGLQSAQFHELFALTESVECDRREELRGAVRGWLHTHLELVEYMIGGLPGSGETSGVRYLERRLDVLSAQKNS